MENSHFLENPRYIQKITQDYKKQLNLRPGKSNSYIQISCTLRAQERDYSDKPDKNYAT